MKTGLTLKMALLSMGSAMVQLVHAQNMHAMLQMENLRGEVKSVQVVDENGWLRAWFDRRGRITMKVSKETAEGPTTIDDDFVYDERGRLLSFDRCRVDREPWYGERHEFAWYRDEDRGGEVVYDDRNETRFEFDAGGNCVLERGSDFVIRRYNEKGAIVEDFSTDYGEEKPEIWIGAPMNVWVVNPKTGLGHEETLHSQPREGNHTFYEYNGYGDVSRVTVKTPEGELVDSETVEYNYLRDSRDNWTERRRTSNRLYDSVLNRGDATFLPGRNVRRVIEYYTDGDRE